ncbi:hypothetical protein XI03_19835 [Bradyrhizobium sp. CCBAU 65884]|nr:hypothetical protein [Bradyrhizobium sp. CCBAU 65884]
MYAASQELDRQEVAHAKHDFLNELFVEIFSGERRWAIDQVLKRRVVREATIAYALSYLVNQSIQAKGDTRRRIGDERTSFLDGYGFLLADCGALPPSFGSFCCPLQKDGIEVRIIIHFCGHGDRPKGQTTFERSGFARDPV